MQVTRQVAQGIADAALIVGVELGSGVGHALILPAGIQDTPLMISAKNSITRSALAAQQRSLWELAYEH